jgi:DNA-binding CsgD family transcriptional regulator
MKRGRPRYDDILTPREWQVLALLAERRTNPEIAVELGISADGAKYHVSQILAKLGVESREEAGRLYRTHRPEQRGLLPLLGFLRQLVAHPAAIPVASFAFVAALALTAWLLLGGAGGAGNRSHSSVDTQAVGLDLPPEELTGAATAPVSTTFIHTLLLTRGTPQNTGSGAATVAAMQQVATLAELKSALTDSIKLVIIDRSALDEVRGAGILRELIETKRILIGLNVPYDELAALSHFDQVVSSGCPQGCEPPGIRAPSVAGEGFYSYLYIDRTTANAAMFMGQKQEYFFEERFTGEVINLDAGELAEEQAQSISVSQFPSERVLVGCSYDNVKIADAVVSAARRELGSRAIYGLMVKSCQASDDGNVTVYVLVTLPPADIANSGECQRMINHGPCSPISSSSFSFRLPVSQILP